MCALLGDDGLYHGRRHQALGFRRHGMPLVGAGTGHRQPGLDLDKPCLFAVSYPSLAGVVARVAHRRTERLQEVGAERDEIVRVRKVVVRHLGPSEKLSIRLPGCLVGERFVADPAGAAQGLHPGRCEGRHGAGERWRDHRDPVSPACVAERLHPVNQILLRVVPWQRVEHALSGGCVGDPAPLGAGNPIRIVEALERGLSANAQSTPVDRVLWVALDFHRATLACAHQGAATGRAFPAHAGIPGRDAGDDVLRRDDERNDLLGRDRRTGGKRHRRPGAAQDLQERPAFHHLNER